MKVLYLLNEFSIGGAEKGLVSLIENGFFGDSHLTACALFRGSGDLLAHLEGKEINGGIHTLMPQQKMGIAKLLLAFFKLRKFIKITSPDIIICSLEQANILGRIATIGLNGCAVVSFEHSTVYSKPYYYPLLKWTFPLVNAVLYDCEGTRKIMQPNYKAHDVPWFYTPLVSVKPAKKPHDYKTRRPFTILSVGRLVKAKNLHESIRSVKLLLDRGHNIKFNIVGAGGLEAGLKELAKLLGIENNVAFLGYVCNWQALCDEADVFLQASVYEGLCISVIEAMATGIPVVATNVGGIIDYGRDGRNMLKTKGYNSGNIADAIEAAMSSEELRKSIGISGQQDVLARFGREEVASELKKVMSAIVGIL